LQPSNNPTGSFEMDNSGSKMDCQQCESIVHTSPMDRIRAREGPFQVTMCPLNFSKW